ETAENYYMLTECAIKTAESILAKQHTFPLSDLDLPVPNLSLESNSDYPTIRGCSPLHRKGSSIRRRVKENFTVLAGAFADAESTQRDSYRIGQSLVQKNEGDTAIGLILSDCAPAVGNGVSAAFQFASHTIFCYAHMTRAISRKLTSLASQYPTHVDSNWAKETLQKFALIRDLPTPQSVQTYWTLLIVELKVDESNITQIQAANYLQTTFGNANFGRGCWNIGPQDTIVSGIADTTNSLEKGLNGSFKASQQRTRKSVPAAVSDLKDFISFQSNLNAASGFATEPDFFGHSTRVKSGRHRSSFVQGQLLSQNPLIPRLLFVQHQITFFPSTRVLEFLDELIAKERISDSLRGRKQRLQQLLSIHKEMIQVSDPGIWSEEESAPSSSDYHWHCTSFYHLRAIRPNASDLHEEWRSRREMEDERTSYRYFSCTCPRHVRLGFCKHSFALGLLRGKFSVPVCR
ncbi:MAG: hypothetical protein AAGM67_10620, partial [Bacteroidota bacterium]